MEKARFKVVIIGGSIAGLTLAHCLDRAGIDYIVLEKNHDIQPQVGGSIGLMPNGSRILAQLGLYDQVERLTSPIEVCHMGFPDSFSFSDQFPRKIHERFGFPLAILTRQQLIEVLYTALSDKSRVKTGKRVARIVPGERRIAILTEDGSEYQGELVVGADGVHSVTRSEMWRAADNQQPGLIQEGEKHSRSAEYSCMWGLSTPVPGIKQGEQIIRSYDRLTFLVFPSQNGCLGWFAIQKLDRKHVYPDIRRFSQKDILASCEALRHFSIWKDVKFGDLLAVTEVCAGTSLEENLFQTWNYGRILCIGDSISKLTPNIAQGANTAIEGAAAVANGLHRLLHRSGLGQPSYDEIHKVLGSYSQIQRKRLKRLHWISHMVTRLQSREGWVNKFVGRYIYPHTGDSTFYLTSNMITEGPVLDYLTISNETEVGLQASSDRYGGYLPWKKTIMFITLLTMVLLISRSL